MMGRVTRSMSHQLTAVVALVGVAVLILTGAVMAVGGVSVGLTLAVLGVGAATTGLIATVVRLASKRLILDGLHDVASVVRETTTTQDYSLRIDSRATNEVQGLALDLNELLQHMEAREEHFRGEGDRLEAEVAARTRELRESNERLEGASAQAIAANRAKSQFIANMTHELRTPMNGVLGMAELLLNTELTEQQQRFTKTVVESGEDLLSIINNVLDFSKMEAGKLEKVDHSPFSPRDCVAKVLELLVGRARLKGLTLTHECKDTVPEAMLGDGKRIRQVLTNIIGNAIKFTDTGKIVVRTSLMDQTDDDSVVRFEVVDTGVGIASHLHQHVFEGFEQADTSTTRQFGGTGLGLAISKHLVELMGGEIGLVSRPEVGSNFWFTVRGSLCRDVTSADRDLDGTRALIVASSGESRDALRHQMTMCGGSGIAVPDVEQTVATLHAESEGQTPIDVVLIDSQALDAPAIARAIRGEEWGKSIPIVLVSTVERDMAELKAEGIDGFLAKPVRQAGMLSAVSKVTGRLSLTVTPEERETLYSRVTPAVTGARILVVEDNEVNREVARTMLATLECEVDVAVDGLQAVEAVQQKAYDLVFLDCQMPNLDGYDAAIEIRRLELDGRIDETGVDKGRRHLPLVALTAHTAPSDRARSLESGMDDYVSKPFSLQTIRRVLARWIEGKEEGTGPEPVPGDDREGGTEAPLLDEATLEQIREVDRLSGGGVLARIVSLFLDEAPVVLATVVEAVQEKDADLLSDRAHALKSLCVSVGAASMATACKQLEALGKSGTLDGAPAIVAELEDLFPTVETALRTRVNDRETDEVTPT